MARPLYKLPDEVAPGQYGHHGLWYDKFCDRWSDAWTMKAEGNGNPKLAWINTVTTGTVGSPETLRRYAQRMYDLATTRGGAALVAKAQSRFVTGLGRSHPVANGFAWHPTLGTPYLAGSSVKGLTHAWALESKQDKDEVTRMFGDRDKAGAVAFLDAVPMRAVKLEADVLTPHYANWTEDDPPGDWRSPVPVPFLVAAPGLSMLFGLVPLRPPQDGDIEKVRAWLASALELAGAGAKTAVGYGHLREDARDTTLAGWEQERRRRIAMATPEGWWRVTIEGLSEEDLLSRVREHLVHTPQQDPTERRAFVAAVLDTGKVTSWKRGEKTDSRTATGSKKLKEAARTVLDCAAELGLRPR